MDHSLAHGIAWTGAIKWSSQVFTWVSTLVVARLVSPSAYGVVGMAALLTGFLALVSEFGLGAAVITMRELPKRELAQMNGAAILFGFLAMVVSCAAAWPIGMFFRSNDVIWVALALSTGFLISAFRTIPSAVLQRDLRFKTVGLIELTQGLSAAIVTLGLAIAGMGYWALALGTIFGSLTATTIYLTRFRQEVAWPNWREIADPIRYSSHILLSQTSWWAYSNADFVIAGRMLGQSALGAYGLAWEVASIPVEKITNVVTRVTPAYFSAVQADIAALRRQFLVLTQAIALLTFPAGLGIALVARQFVMAVLGPTWIAAVLPLRLLALYGVLRSLTTLLPQVLNVKGDQKFVARIGMAFVVVMPASFLLGSQWGASGIAVMWASVYPALTVPYFVRTFQHLNLPVRDYAVALWPAVRGSVTMVCVVLVVQRSIGDATSPWLSLVLESLAGMAVYALTALLPQRQRLLRLLSLFRVVRVESSLVSEVE